jgi:hypothetical protein
MSIFYGVLQDRHDSSKSSNSYFTSPVDGRHLLGFQVFPLSPLSDRYYPVLSYPYFTTYY